MIFLKEYWLISENFPHTIQQKKMGLFRRIPFQNSFIICSYPFTNVLMYYIDGSSSKKVTSLVHPDQEQCIPILIQPKEWTLQLINLHFHVSSPLNIVSDSAYVEELLFGISLLP